MYISRTLTLVLDALKSWKLYILQFKERRKFCFTSHRLEFVLGVPFCDIMLYPMSTNLYCNSFFCNDKISTDQNIGSAEHINVSYNHLSLLRRHSLRSCAGGPISILDGVPLAVKDEIDCMPYPTKGTLIYC